MSLLGQTKSLSCLYLCFRLDSVINSCCDLQLQELKAEISHGRICLFHTKTPHVQGSGADINRMLDFVLDTVTELLWDNG